VLTSKVNMKRANIRFTYSDYLQLPEDKRHEILDGELYEMAAPNTRHQRVSRNLMMALIQHVQASDLGEIFVAPYDVILSEENVVQPDQLFVRKERLGIIGELNISGSPDLVVEILSPGTRSKDLEIKRKIYAAFGVQEYWIVDPEAGSIEVLCWTESGYRTEALAHRSGTLSSPLFPGLALDLAEIF